MSREGGATARTNAFKDYRLCLERQLELYESGALLTYAVGEDSHDRVLVNERIVEETKGQLGLLARLEKQVANPFRPSPGKLHQPRSGVKDRPLQAPEADQAG